MSVNGKRRGFKREDLIAVGKSQGIKNYERIIESVSKTVSKWKHYAKAAGVKDSRITEILVEIILLILFRATHSFAS